MSPASSASISGGTNIHDGGTSSPLKVNAWSIQNNRKHTPNFNGGMTITLGGAHTGNEHVGLISPSVTSNIKHRHWSIHGHAVQSLSGGTEQQSAVIRCGV
jgi:hypothetical protein